MTRRTKLFLSIGGVVVLVAAAAGVIVATSGGSNARAARATTTTTTAPPTSTTAPQPVAPLTGLPDPSGASLTRPALSVKVENTPDARPQAGIDQADVVYEEVVEGNITRFVTIYNSSIPDTIGPVRSVRQQDPDIVWPIGGIFAYSGGTSGNVDLINQAPVHAVDETAADANGAMERNAPGQPPRQAPHNLYGHGPQLLALGGQPVPPPPLFQYLPPDSPRVVADAVTSAHIGFTAGYDPTYTWDDASSTWKRALDGAPATVVGGAQIAPTNVVVQFTNYDGVSNAQTIGEGDVWIFTDGTLRTGRWVRPDVTQPARYVDALGVPILLRPGRTWVELLPVGSTVDVQRPPATTLPAPTTTAPPTATAKSGKARTSGR
jgi:hypothetical protein